MRLWRQHDGTSPRIFGGAITPWSRETAASVLFIESKNSAQPGARVIDESTRSLSSTFLGPAG